MSKNRKPNSRLLTVLLAASVTALIGSLLHKANAIHAARSTSSAGSIPDRVTADDDNGGFPIDADESVQPDGSRVRVEYRLLPSGERQRHGTFTSRRPDGTLQVEGTFKNGERHGQWSVFTADEKLGSRITYLAGILHGEYALYYPNGKISQVGMIGNGEKEGQWRHFAASGKLLLTKEYEGGKPVGDIAFYAPDGQIILRRRGGVVGDPTKRDPTISAVATDDQQKDNDDCGCGE